MKSITNQEIIFLKWVMYVVGFVLVISLMFACNKDNYDKAHLSVMLTDAPASYDAVFIDVQGVEIKGEGESLVMLNANAGIYNLLHFTNGLDTLIATGDLDAGTISQIRLILGPENSVVVDGVSHPLSTPSAEQSGLKLQIHQTFEAGVEYNILLDFDANQSIVLQGNGEYKLRPVLRTINTALSGSIKGSISPISLGTSITATSNGVDYSTTVNSNGYFMIVGLPAGAYDITVIPELPFWPVTFTDEMVVIGESTDLGIIIL
ncbi:MAG: DUF4382 domain-containing protein [Ignavibacteria bacterium]|nr:DUF4382 domain-containing protein [Ignavibacteria bacterium]